MTVTTLLIIDKSGTPKVLTVKDFKMEDLYKKCGFKKPDGLEKRHVWVTKCDKTSYRISVYAKEDGKSNTENKFEFPPPIDNSLFFGSCAVLVEHKNVAGEYVPTIVTMDIWDKLYEKMFSMCESSENGHNIKDQAALIIMIYNNEIENLKIFEPTEGWTLHCAIGGPTSVFEGWGFKNSLIKRYGGIAKLVDNELFTHTNLKYDIVHQFNRIPTWNNILVKDYE